MSQKSIATELGVSLKNVDQLASGDTGNNEHETEKKLSTSVELCLNEQNLDFNESTSIQVDEIRSSENVSLFEELENPSLILCTASNLNSHPNNYHLQNPENQQNPKTELMFETNHLEVRDANEESSTHSNNYSTSISSCVDLEEKYLQVSNPNSSVQLTNQLSYKNSPIKSELKKQEVDRILTHRYHHHHHHHHQHHNHGSLNNNSKKTNLDGINYNSSFNNSIRNINNLTDESSKTNKTSNLFYGDSVSNKNLNSKTKSISNDWDLNYVTESANLNDYMDDQYLNKCNLIVNYLPPYMSQEEVKALFSSIGQVESCKLVREKTTGESLGYAFVKYGKVSEADKAIRTLNGLRLQNKTIKVSIARPSSESIKGANLYICGLPKKMTQSELEDLFSSCGHIINARILYDNKSGLSRGVAFIRFDQRNEAENAVHRFNGFQIQSDISSGLLNEPITVKFANSPSFITSENFGYNLLKQAAHFQSSTNPRSVSTNSASSNNLLNSFQHLTTLSDRFKCISSPGSMVNDLFPALASAAAVVNPLLAPAIAASSGALTATGWCIFVYNIAPETEEANLWQLFGPFGAVQTVKLIRDQDSNKCKGFAFVTMSNYEEALLAIHSLNGFCMGDRVLQVSFKTAYNLKMKALSTKHSLNNLDSFNDSMFNESNYLDYGSRNSNFSDHGNKHLNENRLAMKQSTNLISPQDSVPNSSFNESQPKRSLLVQCPDSGAPIQLTSFQNSKKKSEQRLPTSDQVDFKYELAESFSGALSLQSTPLTLNSRLSTHNNKFKILEK